MTRTHGSLCSGYDGIGLGLDPLLGLSLAYVCEYEAAPSKVLKHRYPTVPNHHDLKTLEWARTQVFLLSAGFPCQPFSGAGKRMGTDDERHLFPWIVQGVERSRPPMVFLENVRGLLTLGCDIVLSELARIGYDVRYTLIGAADVGAPHGRARWMALAADRDIHTWDTPDRPAWGRVHGDEWVDADDGLFGAHPKLLNDKGRVDGILWQQDALLGTPQYEAAADAGGVMHLPSTLLPTPAVNDMGKAYGPDEWDAWCAKQKAAHSNGNGHGPSLEVEAARLGDPLFRTPTAQLAINGGSQHPDKRKQGGHGPTLADEVEHLLPTPKARDAKGCDPNPRGVDLNEALRLLPTPATTDANGARNSTAGRKADSQHHSGDTLSDLVFRGDLLPTPNAAKAGSDMTLTCSGDGRDLPNKLGWAIAETLLPTPRATDGTKGGPNQAGSSGDLMLPSAVMPSRWGRYAAAVARCEALTRPAPDPTQPTGKNGAQRLSPAFVEFMMMLPPGWVTDPALGLKRDAQLKLLGNGVVPAQARAAVRHLLVGLTARQRVSA